MQLKGLYEVGSAFLYYINCLSFLLEYRAAFTNCSFHKIHIVSLILRQE